jgi:HEPN domain-containing protein
MKEPVRKAVKQRLAKTDSNWAAVEILTASDRRPTETVCFHCQQYVEKLLKAFLTLKGIETPKTHDLRRLIQLAEPFEPKLIQLVDDADDLTVHGVQSKYPGDFWQVEAAEMEHLIKFVASPSQKITLCIVSPVCAGFASY